MELNENRIVRKVTASVMRNLVKSLSSEAKVINLDEEPETIRPIDAEEKFGIPEATIRHLVRTKRVKGKIGKPFLVNVKSLRSFIEG